MIFVFGSNLAGVHGAGAAKYAHEHHGAEWGVGEGPTGNAYALPTKGKDIKALPWPVVLGNIRTFLQYARENKDKEFALTPVGCGLAGYKRKNVLTAFRTIGIPDNVYLTSTWLG